MSEEPAGGGFIRIATPAGDVMTKREKSDFERALLRMRSRRPQEAEDGFGALSVIAGDHVSDLIAAFAQEQEHGVRCWLLELIGSARSPEAFDLLCAQAQSTDEALKRWAVWGLKALDTKPARRFLHDQGLTG